MWRNRAGRTSSVRGPPADVWGRGKGGPEVLESEIPAGALAQRARGAEGGARRGAPARARALHRPGIPVRRRSPAVLFLLAGGPGGAPQERRGVPGGGRPRTGSPRGGWHGGEHLPGWCLPRDSRPGTASRSLDPKPPHRRLPEPRDPLRGPLLHKGLWAAPAKSGARRLGRGPGSSLATSQRQVSKRWGLRGAAGWPASRK